MTVGKKNSSNRYLSYLLRLWQTSSQGEEIWRASLEQAGSSELLGFASLNALFDFLTAQTKSGETQREQDD